MSLSSKLSSPPPTRVGRPCLIARELAKMPEKDRAAVLSALEPDSGFTASYVAEAMREDGYDSPVHAMQRHRRGVCTCE